MRRMFLLSMAALLSACDVAPETKQVVVTVTDFCDTMRSTLPDSHGKPTWDVADTARTIQDARRIGAVVDARCGR